MRGIIILNAIIALSFLAVVGAELKVTQVQVLFRHGERTPLLTELYPNDIHNLSAYEPWGLGQLTNTGKVREYIIGQLLKTRYQQLLGSHYLPHTLYAVSTDTDRTKMSLQLVLAGLFPPSEAQTWNSELPWNPIPIHYIPKSLDIIMKAHLCPDFDNELAVTQELPEVRARIAVYSDFFDFLTVTTGLNITMPVQVYEIYNLLVSQKGMNLTLPEWCTESIFSQMGEVTVLYYEISSYTQKAKRINGGQMVNKFIRNMNLDKAKENPRKMYLYSGHESNLSAFLRAHGIVEYKVPHYGSAIMIEKLQNTDGKRFIRLVLWTGVTEQLITLRIPGCEDICPIETYLQLTREVIPSDEETKCHWRRLSVEEIWTVFDERDSYV